MLVSELVNRVRQNLQDTSSTLYSDGEVYDAVNSNKDEVLSLVMNYTDQFPQSTTTFNFSAGTAEVSITASFLSPLYLESIRTGETKARRHDIVDFRDKDLIETNDNLYLRRDSSNVWNIGRRNTDEALSGTIYAIADVDDVDSTAATNTSFVFGPKPADQLIIAGATADLLAARRRQEKSFWENKANRLRTSLIGNLVNYDKTGAEYVHYDEDC